MFGTVLCSMIMIGWFYVQSSASLVYSLYLHCFVRYVRYIYFDPLIALLRFFVSLVYLVLQNVHCSTVVHRCVKVWLWTQPFSRPTQPFILMGSINRVPTCPVAAVGVKAGGHLCRVADNTVWSHWQVASHSSEVNFTKNYTLLYLF